MSKVQEVLSALKRSGRFALDLETSGLSPTRDRILSVNFAVGERAWGLPFVGANALPYRETMEALKPVLDDENLLCVMHNGKFDMQCLQVAGHPLKTKIADTMVAAYLLNESLSGTSGLSLRSLALVELGIELKPFEAFSQQGDLLGGPGIEEKGIEDARVTLALWRDKLEPRLKKDERLLKCFWDLEMPIVRVVAEMELTGVVVDLPWMFELRKKLQAEAQQIQVGVEAIAEKPILLSSTEQVSRLLFVDMGLEPKEFMLAKPKNYQLKKSIGAATPLWSTKEEVLSEYEDASPVAKMIQDHRHKLKLVSTYIDPFMEEGSRDPENRLRTHFWQTGTDSGRLSSSDPVNLQNLPRDPGMIRRGVIAPPGGVLIAADYSQLELRLMAHFSRDPEMMKAYLTDQDIHAQTQAALKIEERTVAKNCNFGLIYGMFAQRLQKELWVKARIRVSLNDCERWILRFFEKYPGVRAYHAEIERQIRANGYVKSLVGRYRRVKGLLEEEQATNRNKGNAFRVAVNFTVQGSAADLAFIAMRNLQRELDGLRLKDPKWLRVRMAAQVHDSFLLEAPQEIGEEVVSLAKVVMESAVKLPSGIPLTVNIGMGTSWEGAESDAKVREKAAQKGKAA